MCSTRGERRLIRIWYQKECVESKLDGQTDSHSDYSLQLWAVQIKILLLLIISKFNTYFVIFGSLLCFKLSQQLRHRFAYQWLDNVKINKYAKFDPNLSCRSRVMSTFTKWPRRARLMLRKASSIPMPVVWQCWHAYVCIYHFYLFFLFIYHMTSRLGVK